MTETKEASVHFIIAVAGTFATAWLGGWDVSLKILVFLMAADYITGILAAAKDKKLDSDIMFWGGIRKAAILVVIMLAVLLDTLLEDSAGPVFRTLAIYYYASREGLSVTENLGLLGVPLPAAMKKALAQLNKQIK